MAITIDAAGRTDVGKVRRNNEDQFLIAKLHKAVDVVDTSLGGAPPAVASGESDVHLFVVADGVGGSAGGALASDTAVRALLEHIGRKVGCYQNDTVEREHDFLSQLEQAVADAHEAITREFGAGRGGPATTLTMVALIWPRAYVVHVGDTRIYHLRKDRLQRLTRDQTMAEVMVDEGVMTEQQAAASPLEHVLSSAVGSGSFEPSVGLIDLAIGDVLVLCSDGLTKHVSDEQIGRIAAEAEPARTICERLVDGALEGGGSDNVTVVVATMDRS